MDAFTLESTGGTPVNCWSYACATASNGTVGFMPGVLFQLRLQLSPVQQRTGIVNR